MKACYDTERDVNELCLQCCDISVILFQYLRFARTLKYYGYIQFQPCISDYPHPNTKVVVEAGGKELNFRVLVEVSLTSCRGNSWVTLAQ